MKRISFILFFLTACLSVTVPAMAQDNPQLPSDSIPDTVGNDSDTSPTPLSDEEQPYRFLRGVIPPSPQAAELARYAEYPVSHATGVPDISIPLYEIDLGGYKLPIFISYHASGARPEQMPTCVGLGWVLNAGGAITRTVLGKPDMFHNSAGLGDYTYFDKANIRELLDNINENGGGNPGDLHAIISDHTEIDTESDRYTFNIAGNTGVFRYSYADREFVVLDNCNYAIYESGAANGSNCSSIRIDTNDGIRYVCAEEEQSGVPTDYTETPYVTAWYVTLIETPYGKIRFYYEHANSADVTRSESIATSGVRPEMIENFDPRTGETYYTFGDKYKIEVTPHSYRYHYGQKLLKKIEWNGNRIDFTYVEEHKNETLQRLTGMKVFSSAEELVKSVSFDNTDNWPTGNTSTGRRLLRSVSDSEKGIWTFEYDKTVLLPALPYLSPEDCTDYWGFWNTSSPASGVSVFTESQKQWLIEGFNKSGFMSYEGIIRSRDRTPSLSHTKAGVLNKITFPTGGYVKYEYELNQVGSQKAGGLRVHSVTVYDNQEAAGRKTTYLYPAPHFTTEDPEKLMNYLSYEQIMTDKTLGNPWPTAFRTSVTTPIFPPTAGGSSVVYSHVVETRNDGTRTSYCYDESEISELFGVSGEFTHPSLYGQSLRDDGIRTPLLQSKTITAPDGTKVYEEAYSYDKAKRRIIQTGVRTVCPYFEHNVPPDLWTPVTVTSYNVAHFGMLQFETTRAYVRANVMKSKTVTDFTTGFSTTTAYTYDPQYRTFSPRSVSVVNSDGSVIKTEYTYTFDHAATDTVCRSMAEDWFMTDCPVETRTYEGTSLVAKERIGYSFSHGTYLPVTVSAWSMPTSTYATERTMPSVLPERERVTAYNAQGRPLSVIVNETDATAFTWDATGTMLLSATSPGGLKTTYTHRPLFGVSSITLPSGHKTTYTYNSAGMLVSEQDTQGKLSGYSYSIANHSAAEMNGSRNSVTSVRYLDGAGTRSVSTRQYYEGLGQPSTLVTGGLNTSGKYVFSAVGYDALGRQCAEVLPGAGGTALEFKTYSDVVSLSSQTYRGDTYTRSETSYDALDRPVAVTTPGQAWRSALKDKKTEYTANAANSVRFYSAPMNTISLVEDGYYAAGTLQGVRTVDEDGKEMTVYTDCLGRKVLERRGPENQRGNNDTYFVYNGLGQLRYVLTPGYELSGYKDKFAYEYRYDADGNMVKKFIPDAGYTQYWYDRAGRLSFMQDPNLRASGLYRFYVYDRAGRPAIQGVTSLCTRGPEVNFADYTGGSAGFMQTGYTLTDASRLQQVTLESVSYYDAYGFASAFDSRLTKTGTASAKGLQTGSVVYSSDGSRSMSASYYDIRGNVTETREVTAFGTLRVTANTYTYSGQPLTSSMTEGSVTMLTENGYHAATGLLLYTDVTVNGTKQRVSAVTYDNIGRIDSVTRGAASGSGGTVAYTYNLHGQTTSISGPGFSQTLHYADGPGTKLYNGSVSAMSWTMGPDATQRGYKYSYNAYNWLTAAEYGEGASLTANKDRYTEKTPEFMRNGGIRRLQRHGLKADGNYGKIDNLHIYYTGNRITGVLEDADPVTTNGSMDYAGTTGREKAVEYNEWGAMTKDEARGITSITYDRFGNPLCVDFSSPNGSYASYVYSATGERLKATHYTKLLVHDGIDAANYLTDDADYLDNIDPPTPYLPDPIGPGDFQIAGMTKLEYHGPVIYRNGYVSMVRFPGGYATVKGSTVTFHYYTQDYLGNNRAVVNGSTGEIEQTVAYYPYGTVIADLGISTLNQPFKFGGKELTTQNGLNEYDFGARQYYPAVPHFTSIDSKCEKYYWLSPYLYCANNPVNAVDPTGNVVICLDEQAQRNISLSLTEDEERFVKFVDGKIDVNLLNQCESSSENMTALKAVANSETSFYVATAEKYTTNGETKEFKESSDKGTVGVTLIPGASEEPSPDNNVHIYVNSQMPEINQTSTTAHELYGHGFFYELNKQGVDVNPFHHKENIEQSYFFNEELNLYEFILTRNERNEKLDKQIKSVSTQAIKNYLNRKRQ